MYIVSLLSKGLFVLLASPVLAAINAADIINKSEIQKDEVRITLFSQENFQYRPPYWVGSHDGQKKLCVNLPMAHVGHVESYYVQGGCCTFYGNQRCKNVLFSADHNERSLSPQHKNKVQSYKCSASGCSWAVKR
ncbi:hypothetical protein BZA77DRAFT_352070 [Pyronema omphalodes]|nr:hypothetical protein BZA77DRAFT_352070 [Pyronema omphalodes]